MPTQPKARQRAFLELLEGLHPDLKRTFPKRRGFRLIDKMNRISKTFFSLLLLYLLGAAEKGYGQPNISGITFDNDHIVISVKINQGFKWNQARFISIKSFPADPPWAPNTHHELWFGGNNQNTVDWFQHDYVEAGTFKVIDPSKVEVNFLGNRKIAGNLNLDNYILKFDSLDYQTYLKTPDIWVEKSSDLINWTIVKISDPLPNEYSISEGLNLKIMKGKSDQEYYRVRMVE